MDVKKKGDGRFIDFQPKKKSKGKEISICLDIRNGLV